VFTPPPAAPPADTFADRFGNWPPPAPGADLTVYQAGERGGAYGPYDYVPPPGDTFASRFGNWGVANPYQAGGSPRTDVVYNPPSGFPGERFGDWRTATPPGGGQVTFPGGWTPPFMQTQPPIAQPPAPPVAPPPVAQPPTPAEQVATRFPTPSEQFTPLQPPYANQPPYAGPPPAPPTPQAPTIPVQTPQGPISVSITQIAAAFVNPSYFGDREIAQQAVQQLMQRAQMGDQTAMMQLAQLDRTLKNATM
jgi:hypothetical protein